MCHHVPHELYTLQIASKNDFLASRLLLSGLFFSTFHSFKFVFNVHLFVITPIPVFVLFIKASELARCRLDLVGAEEVRWGKGNTEQAEGSSRGIGGEGGGWTGLIWLRIQTGSGLL